MFDVNSPCYDGLDNSGHGRVVDIGIGLQPVPGIVPPATTADYIGELYEHGRINLLTAPPQVIQAMVAPLQYISPATVGDVYTPTVGLATLAGNAFNTTYGHYPTAGNPWKSPADILDISSKWAQGLFCANGGSGCSTKHCDDDGNGAFDDYAKRCWLYTYISNWATIRSDCVAVYGTVRLMDTSVSSGANAQPQGLRHFVAVMDRVPATAYQPLLPNGSGSAQPRPNPNYQPPRRLLLTWLD